MSDLVETPKDKSYSNDFDCGFGMLNSYFLHIDARFASVSLPSDEY